MSRLPLDLAAEICGVHPGTLRRWVFDGRIHRYWDGFDLDELVWARESRSMTALAIRAGISPRVVVAQPRLRV